MTTEKDTEEFGLGGIALRLAFALLLVFLTFNPSGHSYFHWLRNHVSPIEPQVVVAGIVLLGAWLFFIRATFTSLGTTGVALLLALFAALIWWMVKAGWLEATDKSTMAWIALGCVGLLLGIGMSWAHIRARLSGQSSVDQVDK
jgi:Family of unknown function (DUF6524)